MRSHRCWEQICDPLNLWRAWTEFCRGKRRRPHVAWFALDADRQVLRLVRELREERYHPGPYRMLRITDPKRRIVAAAPIRDRVVHHALHRVIAPWLDRSFIDQSFACLPGRGSHRAILRFLGEVRRFRWVLQLDIRRYFYSIDRNVLRALLFRRLPEPPLQRLLDRLLDSGAGLYQSPELTCWLGWEAPGRPERGLPIGNLTSQWWGNLYLDGLDHHVWRELRIPSYQRYMDDLTLFANDRGQLLAAREAIADWLSRERGLRLKDPDARPDRTDRHFHYLGYEISRRGLRLGPKARARVVGLLRRQLDRPRGLRSCLGSIAAAWLFGARAGSRSRSRRAESVGQACEFERNPQQDR